MKLDILRDSLDQFAKALSKGWVSGLEPLYESIAPFQAAWPPTTAADLPTTLDAALVNSRSRVFWQGHAYHPKELLILLGQFSPDTMNMAFGRLYNQSLNLAARYSGFTHYLDELLGEYQRVKGATAPQIHFHTDYRAPSLYCALRFPATDAYFESEVYASALRTLQARDVSQAPDPERFGKSCKVIGTFIAKHEALQKAHLARLQPNDYIDTSALLVSEYFRYLQA